MTNTTFLENMTDLRGAQLRGQASKLSAAGIAVLVDGDSHDNYTDFQTGTQVQVKLGKGSDFTADGGRALIAVFETVDPASPEYAALASAAANASCVALLDRIALGWTEKTPEGKVQHLLAVQASDAEEFETLVRTLPTRSATIDGTTLARLRFGQTATVAPSATGAGEFTPLSGTPGKPAVITASELFGLGVVMDEASDERDRLARTAHDVRMHDANTNLVRDRFNRVQHLTDVERLLVDTRWVKAEATAFSTTYEKEGRTGELVHSNLVFIDRGEGNASLRDDAVTYRAFDMLVGTARKRSLRDRELDGSENVKHTLATPADVADWLLDQGHITVDVDMFVAGGTIPTVKLNQPTHELMRDYANAIRSGRAGHDASVPLAFNRTVNGESTSVVSVTPANELIRWEGKSASGLLIAAAQLAAETVIDKDTGMEVVKKYAHSVPESIINGVMTALRKRGVLAGLEHFASEPLLTPDGHVVQEAGYDLDAKAYLAIPHRERAMWKRGYTVPENPTREQAQAAYKFLETELLTDFPFTDETAKARAMSYLLTAAGRSLTTGSPAFGVDAPTRGTGKSLVLLIGRILGQGSPRATGFYWGLVNDAETKKGLASLLAAGGRFFHCDESPPARVLKSVVIQELVTGVDGDDELRLLSTNETVTRTGIITTFAGPQLEVGGDLNRRVLMIKLAVEAGKTVVGRSGFRHANIIEFVKKSRPQLLAAVHTVLLHGLQNEPVHEINGMGFNHNWAHQILGAMSHIQLDEGLSAAETAMEGWFDEVDEQDETGDQWGELLAHLWAKSFGRQKTAAELVSLSKAVNTQAGEQRPALLPSLLGLDHVDSASRKWAIELKVVNRTPVPFDGSRYVLERVEGKSKSKHASQYMIRRFVDEELVIPGHDAPAEAKVASEVAAAEVEQADFS